MFQRFTNDARTAVVAAQVCARQLHADRVEAVHLLLGLFQTTGTARRVLDSAGADPDRVTAAARDHRGPGAPEDADHLQELGIDLAEVRRRVEAAFGPGALEGPPARRRGLLARVLPASHLPFGRDAKKALENSLRAALDLGHHHVGGEHVLLALLLDPHVAGVLRAAGAGLDPATARALVLQDLRRPA